MQRKVWDHNVKWSWKEPSKNTALSDLYLCAAFRNPLQSIVLGRIEIWQCFCTNQYFTKVEALQSC